MNRIPLLGVNIDHVASVRQARKTLYPEPLHAALIAESAGADGITVHLREDRRHIQERDIDLLQQTIQTRLNLEIGATAEMLNYALLIRPTYCCLVPERRHELTTEGGLDIIRQQANLTQACERLQASGITVSLFIDPDLTQIKAALNTGAKFIELHTGNFAEATTLDAKKFELQRIIQAAEFATNAGITVNAGHGLHYHNVSVIAKIPQVHELNIGHAIISRAIFVGLYTAVKEMKELILNAR